jgi:hypothetical protein
MEMIIKCVKFVSETTKKELSSSPWLTINKKYVVLTVKVKPSKGISVIIYSDHYGEPIFSSLDGFEIISQHIPSNWAPKMDENGIYYLMPKSWMYEEFFEEVEDEKPHAVELFKKEATIIYQEEGWEYE